MNSRAPAHTPYGQRPSKSADAAHQAELIRLRAMTPRERMLEALACGDFMRLFVKRYAVKLQR